MATKTTTILLICCAGGLAAFSGWKVGDELFLRSAEAAFAKSSPSIADTVQTSNRDAKRDRDVVAAKPTEPDMPVLALARIEPEPQPVVTEPLPFAKPELQLARAEIAPPPPPTPKPKIVAKIERAGRALLNDLQIAGIKQRLSLTAAQERYWPAVEKALRGLSERAVDYQKRLNRSPDESADAEAAEIKQLKSAARPFLAQLREGQKSEVIMLATMAGLGPIVTELAAGRDVAKNEN